MDSHIHDPSQDGAGPSPRGKLKGITDYLLIIRDRWLLSVALALPVALGYVYKEYQQPSVYQSQSSFQLVPPPAIINLQPVDRENRVADLVRKHKDGLSGQELRAKVNDRIKASKAYTETMLAPFVKDQSTPPPADVAATVQYSVAEGGDPARPVFTITSLARDGESARLVADIVQQEYDKLWQSQKGKRMESARETIALLIKNSQEKEKEIRQQLNQFKLDKNIPYIEDRKSNLADRKSNYSQEVTNAMVQKVGINSLMRQILGIQHRIKAQGDLSSHSVNRSIDTIKEYFEIDAIESFGNVPLLRKQLVELEKMRRLYERGKKYLEKHPKMIENATQIQDVEKLLNLEVQAAIEDLRDKFHQLESTEDEFRKALEKALDESKTLAEQEIIIEEHQRSLQIVQASTDMFLRRLREVQIESEMPTEDDPLRKNSYAHPGVQISPDKIKIRNIGFLIFSGLFIIIPFAFEFIDNRVKSPWDVEVFLGRDLIAGIPKISEVKESERPLIVGNELDDGLTEAFRSMYSRIQMNSKTDYPKSILITSAIPSEGKSLLAANLAYSCANHGRKTILIDYDLRRPGLHKFCGVNNDRGLLTLINENAASQNPAESLLSSGSMVEIYPNLFILPSGGKTRAATEMLEKPEFDAMLHSLREVADVIIIDSPPIGLFPDSLAMARKADEVLFVTRYGKVARKVAKNLLESLDGTGVNILGVVLNDLPEKKTPGYYYSGYYGYGYFRYKYYNKYYGKQAPEKTAKKPAKFS